MITCFLKVSICAGVAWSDTIVILSFPPHNGCYILVWVAPMNTGSIAPIDSALGRTQNGRYFTDELLKLFFFNENRRISK